MEPFDDEDVIDSESTSVTNEPLAGPPPAPPPPAAEQADADAPAVLTPQPIPPTVDYRTPDTPEGMDLPKEASLAVKMGAWLILAVVSIIGLGSCAAIVWVVYKCVRMAYGI